jgi:hypothetical protein
MYFETGIGKVICKKNSLSSTSVHAYGLCITLIAFQRSNLGISPLTIPELFWQKEF